MSYRNNTLQRPDTGRNPRVASTLSIFPGLGQIYNSEPRKGVLFMLVGLTNFVVLLFIVLSTQFLHLMKTFSQELNLRPNHQLMEALATVQIGSPVANSLLLLFFCFTIFAMREAFDRALLLRKQAIYATDAMNFSEASSGSYLFHIALMVTILILSFFFLIPPAPRQQVTEIEFVQPDEKTHEKVKTNKRSSVNSRQQKDPTVQRTSRDPHKASSESRAQAATTQRTQQARPMTDRRTMPRAEAQKQQSQPNPQPTKTTPAPSVTRTPTPPAPAAQSPTPPRPVPRVVTGGAFAPVPKPVPQQPTGVTRVMPQPSTTPPLPMIPNISSLIPAPMAAKSNATVGTTPGPISVKTGQGRPSNVITNSTTTGPSTQPGIEDIKIGGKGKERGPVSPKEIGTKGDDLGKSEAPIPGGRKNGPTKGSDFQAIAPTFNGGPQSPSKEKPGPGPSGDKNRTATNPTDGVRGNPNPESTGDIPWDAYMADLQRRIKRSWFPPQNGRNLRVKVIFTVHTNGTMSGMQLKQSSGMALADQAAMKAVQNAAPFRPLPEGAPPSADIEFTFDYNVFHGGGSGRMRGF